jgi:XTP/dITP diphosphohydrolase
MQLVLASNNSHKLHELQQLLDPLGLTLRPQDSLGISPADEPHPTFVENALAKARHAAAASGCAAMADDSGLSVDALNGAPGVLSARYATLFGQTQSDENNNQMLLHHLQGQTQRRARFICTLAAVRFADDPEPLIAMGRWSGEILSAPQGQGGFGYDPLMLIPALGLTVAQLSPTQKNQFSHRALAMQQLLVQMREVWRLG